MSENEKNMNENEKVEGSGADELTEEELREFERKEKRDNAIISTVIDGIMTFLHLS